MSSIHLFATNKKLYEEEISLYLVRKIFFERTRCCLKATKNKEECKYADEPDHIYMREVSGAHEEVQNVCEMLCMGPVFINSYSVSPLWKRQFNQSGYMKYHLEQWYINAIRLEDMLLGLINAVYRLGIKKELLGYEVVSTNSNLPANVVSNLKALHKATRSIRAARIMFIHHQTLFEKDLHEIRSNENMVKLIQENPPEEEDKELEKSIILLQFWTKKFITPRYRAKKRDYMLESNQTLLKHIAYMLLGMEKTMEANHDSLVEKRAKLPKKAKVKV